MKARTAAGRQHPTRTPPKEPNMAAAARYLRHRIYTENSSLQWLALSKVGESQVERQSLVTLLKSATTR